VIPEIHPVWRVSSYIDATTIGMRVSMVNIGRSQRRGQGRSRLGAGRASVANLNEKSHQSANYWSTLLKIIGAVPPIKLLGFVGADSIGTIRPSCTASCTGGESVVSPPVLFGIAYF